MRSPPSGGRGRSRRGSAEARRLRASSHSVKACCRCRRPSRVPRPHSASIPDPSLRRPVAGARTPPLEPKRDQRIAAGHSRRKRGLPSQIAANKHALPLPHACVRCLSARGMHWKGIAHVARREAPAVSGNGRGAIGFALFGAPSPHASRTDVRRDALACLLNCHAREGGHPVTGGVGESGEKDRTVTAYWSPAFAGMTQTHRGNKVAWRLSAFER